MSSVIFKAGPGARSDAGIATKLGSVCLQGPEFRRTLGAPDGAAVSRPPRVTSLEPSSRLVPRYASTKGAHRAAKHEAPSDLRAFSFPAALGKLGSPIRRAQVQFADDNSVCLVRLNWVMAIAAEG